MTDRKLITADEARALLDGTAQTPWRWYWGQGIISLQGADGTAIATDLSVAEADLLAAAPDLAHTVISQAEQIKRLQAYARSLEDGYEITAYIRDNVHLKPGDMEEP